VYVFPFPARHQYAPDRVRGQFFACPAEGERLKKKLSYKEMRELETMEERIAEKRSKEVMK
jgi:hypothetical protein